MFEFNVKRNIPNTNVKKNGAERIKSERASPEITEKERCACCYLAEEAKDYLSNVYDTEGKSDVMEKYMCTLIGAGENHRMFVMGMVCTLLEDNDMPELSLIIKRLILGSDTAIEVFVNAFVSASISCMFFDEEDDDDIAYEECDFYE